MQILKSKKNPNVFYATSSNMVNNAIEIQFCNDKSFPYLINMGLEFYYEQISNKNIDECIECTKEEEDKVKEYILIYKYLYYSVEYYVEAKSNEERLKLLDIQDKINKRNNNRFQPKTTYLTTRGKGDIVPMYRKFISIQDSIENRSKIGKSISYKDFMEIYNATKE